MITPHSAGNDIAALMPKYITVKRGFFICAGMNPSLVYARQGLVADIICLFSCFIRNLPVVLALIRIRLYQLPELLPDLPERYHWNPDLRLLPLEARPFRHPYALLGTQRC